MSKTKITDDLSRRGGTNQGPKTARPDVKPEPQKPAPKPVPESQPAKQS